MKQWNTSKKIVVSALSVLMLLLIVIVGQFLIKINTPERAFADVLVEADPAEALPSPSVGQVIVNPSPSPTIDPEEALAMQSDREFMKKRVNILVMGLDRSTEREDWITFRSDTMLLVSINFEDNKIHMISVPRDSCVKVAVSGNTLEQKLESGEIDASELDAQGKYYIYVKINTIFPSAGKGERAYNTTMEFVSNLFGNVPIHYYIGFDMNVVKDVVNAMGGVDYDVDTEINMNGRHLTIGQQHLNGQAVLDYCRQRKGSSDIARVDRQQRMLIAIFNQMKKTDQLVNIPQIFRAVQQNIETNLSFTQICSLALFFNNLQSGGIERHVVEGEFLNMDKLSYWGISGTKFSKLVKTVFGKKITLDPQLDVTNIKKELEQKKAILSEALTSAKQEIAGCEGLLNLEITQEQRLQISKGIAQLRLSCEHENIEEIRAQTDALYTIRNAMGFTDIREDIPPEVIPPENDF